MMTSSIISWVSLGQHLQASAERLAWTSFCLPGLPLWHDEPVEATFLFSWIYNNSTSTSQEDRASHYQPNHPPHPPPPSRRQTTFCQRLQLQKQPQPADYTT